MKACIIKPHRAGMWSLINNVITCSLIYDRIFVDWDNNGCLYGTPEDGNIWNHLFRKMVHPSSIREVTQIDVLDTYTDQWLTYKNAGKLYKGEGRPHWRFDCHAAWRKLYPLPEITQAVWTAYRKVEFYDVVAVLVRAHENAGEQISDRSQGLDEYAKAIEDHGRNYSRVLFMGDEESQMWFSERFPVITYPSRRSVNRSVSRHLTEPQTVQDAKDVLIETMLLSMARVLIHPVSNIATAALYMNQELQSVFLE